VQHSAFINEDHLSNPSHNFFPYMSTKTTMKKRDVLYFQYNLCKISEGHFLHNPI
jgi:hypothetical protein